MRDGNNFRGTQWAAIAFAVALLVAWAAYAAFLGASN
jgi:hypothetical protein